MLDHVSTVRDSFTGRARRLPGLATLTAAAALGTFASPAAAATCESLAKLSIPDVTIASAQTVAAGAFVPPPGRGGAAPNTAQFKDAPAFCRVQGSVKRAGATDAKIEYWLPMTGWNGDFQPAAGGFGGGTIGYTGEHAMVEIIKHGAATGATNRGHDNGGPPRWISSDISAAAYHPMVDVGKKVVAAFYDKMPTFTVMNECGGAGSRDAMQLTQEFPADLDLVASTGFTNWGTHHGIAQMWVWQAAHKSKESIIPLAKLDVIHQGALAACDAKDGVKDGVITDPERCKFDPAVLQCKGADAPNCLNAAQVEAVRTIYKDPVHAKTGAYLYGSMPPGGELGWDEMTGERPYPFAPGFYRDQVFKDPKWDYNTQPVNFDTHVDLADSPENLPINATNPDLTKFVERGGKLMLVGGWNDHTLGPGNNVHYYQEVVKKMGQNKIKDSVRLFMVPGMDHCFGAGYGPNEKWPTIYRVDFDATQALKDWKKSGKAPDSIVVTTTAKDNVPKKRLVCAYPKVAQYNGKGNVDDPTNFSCKNP